MASHAEDPGSIPGGGATKKTYTFVYVFFVSTTPGMECAEVKHNYYQAIKRTFNNIYNKDISAHGSLGARRSRSPRAISARIPGGVTGMECDNR